MKEAVGELNSTLIVVIAVAALAALFFTVIWPMINDDIKYNSNCSNAICNPGIYMNSTGLVCYWVGKDGKKNPIECPYTG